jgi:hypothetical protein
MDRRQGLRILESRRTKRRSAARVGLAPLHFDIKTIEDIATKRNVQIGQNTHTESATTTTASTPKKSANIASLLTQAAHQEPRFKFIQPAQVFQ